MRPECPKRPIVRAQASTLRKVAHSHGLATDQDIARHLGISPATMSRLMHGATAGGRVIAAIWARFALTGDARIDDLFAVHLVDHEQETVTSQSQLASNTVSERST